MVNKIIELSLAILICSSHLVALEKPSRHSDLYFSAALFDDRAKKFSADYTFFTRYD
jgi:hypothetical protein